jgi:hypothetical protein
MLLAMMRLKHLSSQKNLLNIFRSTILIIVIVWGLRVIIIEGFILARDRKWAGDFTSAFYDEIYWNDDGYMYGPVFTLIKAISNELPHLFRIEMFAGSNVFIFITTLLILWKIFEVQSLRTVEKLAILALVCTFSHLYYAFSVSAFPEFLELLMICIAFYLLKKSYFKSSMVVLGFATMVKMVPVVVVPFLFPIVGLSGILAFIGTIIFFMTTMVIYLDINYFEATYKIFEIGVRGSGNIFHPESTEHYGLSSALGRLEISLLPTNFAVVAAILIICITYAVAVGSNQLTDGKRSKQKNLEFLSALTPALIPFVSSATHRHSFIFLIPLAFYIVKIKNLRVKFTFMISFLVISLPIYSLFSVDIGIVRYLYHEPVVMNFIVLIMMILFGIKNKESRLSV